jgi:hypothetical protein
MIVQELVGKKVVVHVGTATAVVLHRGVLESVDEHFIKLRKDNETIYFVLVNIIGIQGV